MAKAVHSKVVISAQDKVSPTLKNIQAQFKSFSKAAQSLGSEFKGLAALSLAPLAGGLTAAFAAAKSAVFSMSEYGTAVDNTARSLGVASDNLQAFRYAADLGGSSAAQMDAALEMMNRKLADVAAGKNKDLPEMMKKLGISLYKANGELKRADELLPEVADAIRSQGTQAQKAYIATQLFGRSGQQMIKMLDGGSEGLAAARAEAEHFGAVLSEDDVAAATAFGDSLTRTRYAVQGVQNSIGSKLLPVLQPMLDEFNEWIATNREWLATTIGDAVKDFAASLREIDFKAVITGAMGFVKQCVSIFNQLGGLKTVGIAVAAIFGGKLVASVISTTSAVFGLVKAAGALSAALLANPIGLVVAAIAGLIAAGVALYENWGEVCAWARNLWTELETGFPAVAETIAAVWQNLVTTVTAIWENLKAVFSGVIDFVKAVFAGEWEAAWLAVADIFDGFVGLIKAIWAPVVEFFSGIWNAITGDAESILDGLVKFFTETIPNAIKAAWEALKEWFLGIIESMLKPVQGIIDTAKNIAGAVSDTVGGAVDAVGDAVGGAMDAVSNGISKAWNWAFGDDDEQQAAAPSAAAASVPAEMLERQEVGVGGEVKIVVSAAEGSQVDGMTQRSDNAAVPLTASLNTGATR